MNPQEVMEEYGKARASAGTIGDGYPLWRYEAGWYTIGYGKYRKAQVLEMIERLKARAELNP